MLAQKEARRLGCFQVAAEHLLFALLCDEGRVGALLRQQGLTVVSAHEKLLPGERGVSPERLGPDLSDAGDDVSNIDFNDESLGILSAANLMAINWKHGQVQNAHLLKAILASRDAVNSAIELLHLLGADRDVLNRKADTTLKLMEQEGSSSRSSLPHSDYRGRTEISASHASKNLADYFTAESSALIAAAGECADDSQLPGIGVKQILTAMVKSECTLTKYAFALFNLIGSHEPDAFQKDEALFSPDGLRAMEAAFRQARQSAKGAISPELILLGIIEMAKSSTLFPDIDLDKLASIRDDITEHMLLSNAELSQQQYIDLTAEPAERLDDIQERSNDPSQSEHQLLVTIRVARILKFAKDESLLSGHHRVQAPHLVLALIREAYLSEVTFIQNRAFDIEEIRAWLDKRLEIVVDRSIDEPEDATPSVKFAPSVKHILQRAHSEAKRLRSQAIDMNHLALALLRDEECLVSDLSKVTDLPIHALQRRLEQCVFWQHHTKQTDVPGVYLNLTRLDEEIGPSAPRARVEASAKSLERSLEQSLSRRSEIVFGLAAFEARKFGHSHISIECIILGLLHETFGATFDTFCLHGLNFHEARLVFQHICVRGSDRSAAARTLSHNAWCLLEKSRDVAQSWQRSFIEPEHILLAVADEHRGIAAIACDALSIDGNQLRSDLIEAMTKLNNKPGNF